MGKVLFNLKTKKLFLVLLRVKLFIMLMFNHKIIFFKEQSSMECFREKGFL